MKTFEVLFKYETTLGTERCNEALHKLEKKYDIVVNIQGDEPLIEPEIIDGIVKALQVKELIPFSYYNILLDRLGSFDIKRMHGNKLAFIILFQS